MGPGTKWAQLPEAPLLPKREAGSGWDGRGNDQGQSCFSNSLLGDTDPPAERREGHESAPGFWESPRLGGSGIVEGSEMGWGGRSGVLLDNRGCPQMVVKGCVPSSPALTNVLNSRIAPRGPCTRQ